MALGVTIMLTSRKGRYLTVVFISAALCACGGRQFGTPPIPPGLQSSNAAQAGGATTISEFSLPAGQPGPIALTIGSDRNLWVLTPGSVERATPAGSVTVFAVPGGATLGGGITLGADGAVWTLGTVFGGIGPCTANAYRIAPDGTFAVHALFATACDDFPADITRGPDGTVWFAFQGGFACGPIGSITTGGTVDHVVNFCNPNGIASSVRLSRGGDGFVYLAQFDRFGPNGGPSNVYQLTTAGVIRKTFAFPDGSQPEGIAAGKGHDVWVTLNGANAIAKIDSVTGRISTFPIPTPNALAQFDFGIASGTSQIVDGGARGMWFVENGANAIGRIAQSGRIFEFAVPTQASGLSGVAMQESGAGPLWFVENRTSKVGRLSGV